MTAEIFMLLWAAVSMVLAVATILAGRRGRRPEKLPRRPTGVGGVGALISSFRFQAQTDLDAGYRPGG
jgi:hypothetical protein